MILFLKHAAITVAALVAFLGALISVVAFISQGMSDNPNDDTGGMLAFSSACVVAVCILLIFTLSGCAELRALQGACQDGLCR